MHPQVRRRSPARSRGLAVLRTSPGPRARAISHSEASSRLLADELDRDFERRTAALGGRELGCVDHLFDAGDDVGREALEVLGLGGRDLSVRGDLGRDDDGSGEGGVVRQTLFVTAAKPRAKGGDDALGVLDDDGRAGAPELHLERTGDGALCSWIAAPISTVTDGGIWRPWLMLPNGIGAPREVSISLPWCVTAAARPAAGPESMMGSSPLLRAPEDRQSGHQRGEGGHAHRLGLLRERDAADTASLGCCGLPCLEAGVGEGLLGAFHAGGGRFVGRCFHRGRRHVLGEINQSEDRTILRFGRNPSSRSTWRR